MTTYLQPSLVRGLLDSTIEFRRSGQGEFQPLDHSLAVRVRFLGTALVGIVQAVHSFAVWVIMSAVSLTALGFFESLEKIADRAQSLCGAGMVGVAMAITSVFDTRAAEFMSNRIAGDAGTRLKALCDEFERTFDEEAEERRSRRQARAHARHQVVRPEFFQNAVKEMRAERRRVSKECVRGYPADPEMKYEALVASQARMYGVLCRQRRELNKTPYTQAEVDTHLVNKTLEMADEALVELYRYPKVVLAERLKAWGKKDWDREGFQEQCLGFFDKNRIPRDIESLVRNVKGANAKEKAFQRFTKDLSALVRREKKQIDKAEKPNILKRIWWSFELNLGI